MTSKRRIELLAYSTAGHESSLYVAQLSSTVLMQKMVIVNIRLVTVPCMSIQTLDGLGETKKIKGQQQKQTT